MADSRLQCSVVLEGGVTSAVIYASLLARLSRHYTFKQLGGTSSGAVAAAAAAAAEYARDRAATAPTQAEPFKKLGRFPDDLARTDGDGQPTMLFKLFQAQGQGQALLRVALAVMKRNVGEGFWATLGRLVLAVAMNFWWLALPAALVVVGVGRVIAVSLAAWAGCSPLCAMFVWLVAELSVLVAAVGLLLAVALWLAVKVLRGNHWGLCNGMTEAGIGQEALTPTLHGFFQGLAGKPLDQPLTFKDLWADPAAKAQPERHIDLQIVTSAISLMRPVRLPGDGEVDPLHEFFYDPKEWAALFPAPVLKHLEQHARPATLRHADGRVLLALPSPGDWPVVMAVRFSLSFPILLSAVPMYVARWRRERRQGADGESDQTSFDVLKVYFSDGGITSNCPVHLFDKPLPAFPTFAVNLHKGGQRRLVRRSDTRDPELDAAATHDATAWRDPVPFLMSILGTALGWRDSLQRRLPGYRERVVHVGVPPAAGGLNLAMTPDTIRMLATLGKCAARTLHRDFSTPRRSGEPNAWERHRWVRARTTLAALRRYLSAFAERLRTGDPDYPRLLRTASPARYAFEGEAAREQALTLAAKAQELVRALDATVPPDALDRNAPQALPALHMSPPW